MLHCIQECNHEYKNVYLPGPLATNCYFYCAECRCCHGKFPVLETGNLTRVINIFCADYRNNCWLDFSFPFPTLKKQEIKSGNKAKFNWTLNIIGQNDYYAATFSCSPFVFSSAAGKSTCTSKRFNIFAPLNACLVILSTRFIWYKIVSMV